MDPFSFKTGSITRQDDFDVNAFGWNYTTNNTLVTHENAKGSILDEMDAQI
jgi:hypothetical protein